jgi:hypothetical protein
MRWADVPSTEPDMVIAPSVVPEDSAPETVDA